MSLNKDWNKFLLGEGLDERNVFTYLQGLQEILSTIKPKSMTEERRLSLAKQHLKEARRSARRMQNELQVLEERLNILEESRNEDI
jgi:hypothetical protein|tara:strand:- start:2874 stop:3131 length:258 start_codon:yes stop_codon:yes gene_type:complete